LGGQLYGGRRQGNCFTWVFGASNCWLVKPPNVGAKKFNLINGLWGASALKFGWAVGGKNQQWNAAVKSFNYGGEIVGGCRARSAYQGHRSPGSASQTQSKKPARAFIKVYGDFKVRGLVSGYR